MSFETPFVTALDPSFMNAKSAFESVMPYPPVPLIDAKWLSESQSRRECTLE
jgi:hypothetical protein